MVCRDLKNFGQSEQIFKRTADEIFPGLKFGKVDKGPVYMEVGEVTRRGRKIKRVYIQSYKPGVLGWGFLRLLLRLPQAHVSRKTKA